MFLVEFQKDEFIDGERIDYISLTNNKVTFTLSGDSESLFTVEKILEPLFMNHIQALNNNITEISSRHLHINNSDTKY